jgi:hypothetical protein
VAIDPHGNSDLPESVGIAAGSYPAAFEVTWRENTPIPQDPQVLPAVGRLSLLAKLRIAVLAMMEATDEERTRAIEAVHSETGVTLSYCHIQTLTSSPVVEASSSSVVEASNSSVVEASSSPVVETPAPVEEPVVKVEEREVVDEEATLPFSERVSRALQQLVSNRSGEATSKLRELADGLGVKAQRKSEIAEAVFERAKGDPDAMRSVAVGLGLLE